LEGHSDADVLCHAIGDALLGGSSSGDIGHLFPDTDKKYKDISSLILLKKINGIIKSKGYYIENIDSTILLEQPKVEKYIDDMRVKLAQTLEIEFDRISVKATTSEKMGFVGKKEGVAAYAVILLGR